MPEFELREVAAFGHVSWREFQTWPSDEQAAAVAHYRLHNLIELHSNDAVSRATEQRVAMQRRGTQ